MKEKLKHRNNLFEQTAELTCTADENEAIKANVY